MIIMKNNYSIIKRLLIICVCIMSCSSTKQIVFAETNEVRASYVTGKLQASDGKEYLYTISINGSTVNGVRTVAATNAYAIRTHYAVYAQFMVNGIVLSSTSNPLYYNAMSGTSYSYYSIPGDTSGITSILSGHGNVYLQFAGTKYVSF